MSALTTKPSVLSDQAYENVCKCRHSPPALKQKYILRMAACGSDDAKAKDEHSRIRVGQLRAGPAPALEPDEGLGALIPETVFVRKTAAAFKMTAAAFKKKMDLWLRYEEKRLLGQKPTESERESATGFLRSRLPARQDGEVWLFRHPERKRDAFDGVTGEWLGHRLGLRLQPGEVRLTFGFRANHVDNVAEPRFLDATWSYLPLWDWRGKTRPLPGTPPGLDGFDELVADPPELRSLDRPVIRVVASAT
jgi:hypothetical protein